MSPEAKPAVSGVAPDHRDGHDRRQRQPAAEREEGDAGRDVGEVVALDGHARQQREAGRDGQQPGQQRRPRPEARIDPREDEQRHGADPESHRQHAEARLRGAVAQDALEVQGDEELKAEHGADQQRVRGVGAHDQARAQHLQRDEGPRGRRLAHREGAEQRRGRHREPARGAVDDRHDGQHQPAHQQRGAGHVGPLAQAGARVAREHATSGEHGGDPERHVDEEDPAPAGGAGDEAAEEEADRGAEAPTNE